MSRIGKKVIEIPAGVEIKVSKENLVTVKGPKGTLTQEIHANMTVAIEGNELTVTRPNDKKDNRSLHGLSRSLINNMVVGVVEGYKKELEINGVGYKAAKQGKKLVLSLGFSHPVDLEDPEGVTSEVEGTTKVIITGIDKQKVGQFAATIRSKRPPEPYKGKGVKYVGEHIRRKEGKSGK